MELTKLYENGSVKIVYRKSKISSGPEEDQSASVDKGPKITFSRHSRLVTLVNPRCYILRSVVKESKIIY